MPVLNFGRSSIFLIFRSFHHFGQQLYIVSVGEYSGLIACFTFERNKGYYFVQLFLPAAAVVSSTWMVLWMQSENSFSDMINLKLTITLLYFSYNTFIPRVAHIKAMWVVSTPSIRHRRSLWYSCELHVICRPPAPFRKRWRSTSLQSLRIPPMRIIDPFSLVGILSWLSRCGKMDR